MDITLIAPDRPLPIDRAYALSMTIKSFKGRRDVEVHLFRSAWDPEEEEAVDWDKLLAAQNMSEAPEASGSRHVVLEALTVEERDKAVAYLKEHYASRLSGVFSAPIPFPVPIGLVALSDLTEGKSIGFIHFERIPHFNLGFALRGFYDLAQHAPIVGTESNAG
ncbi:hypothetical protein SAMN04488503_0310 [Humidesulfovibrio mexicanus]|uniref:Uncharacterized protein n=1 Tax=Humidesulfovibrio mexicanus TaxID=147047 RepID=A0A238XQF6_9BACT|nr:hypothetical protein [Humidesulfovibrio mexicanus]SNR60693.1 hypothetical protein SAMN04488503_0310 [Humidesulfovibrio mexicanus]